MANQIGVNRNTLRAWVQQAEHDNDTTIQPSDAERIKQLEQENFELRCVTLRDTAVQITPSTYYFHHNKQTLNPAATR